MGVTRRDFLKSVAVPAGAGNSRRDGLFYQARIGAVTEPPQRSDNAWVSRPSSGATS